MKNRLVLSLTLTLLLPLLADTANNGIFRFLTQSLPEGTTNAEYVGRFVTANADGPVTFTSLSALPAGLYLDPQSGFLTGIPTATFNGTITVKADDGSTFSTRVENKKDLEGVKAGDRIDITYTQALAVSVESPK